MAGMTDDELLNALDMAGSWETEEAAKRIRELKSCVDNHLPTALAERVMHVKRGSEYLVLPSSVELQSSAGPVAEGAKLVVYMSVAGDQLMWARPEEEFRDGRFVTVGTGYGS